MKKRILFFSLWASTAFAQAINLHKSNAHAIGADAYITTPIHRNMAIIHAFALVILFIIALVASYKIYVRWQMGEDDVLPLIYRWWGGIVLCFFILQFLRNYISRQSFGEFQPVGF